MQAADDFFPLFEPSFHPRPGPRQVEALRRLRGRWLLERDGDAVYWCTMHGRRVPPYYQVRRSLFASLRDNGLVAPIHLRPGRAFYTISEEGGRILQHAGRTLQE